MRDGDLVTAGDVPISFRLQADVDVVALGHELVEAEREQGPLGKGMPRLGTRRQHLPDRFRAGRHVESGGARQIGCSPGHSGGSLAHEGSVERIFGETERGLYPAGQRIGLKGFEGLRGRADDAGRKGPGVGFTARTTHQGFPNDPPRSHLVTEELACDRGDDRLLLGAGPGAGHGCRGAHALQIRCLARLPYPADQHCHIGALSAAVRVQFVEHQELESAGSTDQLLPFLRAGQQQFEHHVVGEQDVRRIGQDSLAFLVGFLSCVPGEGDRLVAGAVAVSEELA